MTSVWMNVYFFFILRVENENQTGTHVVQYEVVFGMTRPTEDRIRDLAALYHLAIGIQISV